MADSLAVDLFFNSSSRCILAHDHVLCTVLLQQVYVACYFCTANVKVAVPLEVCWSLWEARERIPLRSHVILSCNMLLSCVTFAGLTWRWRCR